MFLHQLTEEIAETLAMNYYSINAKRGSETGMYQEITDTSWKAVIDKYLAQSEKRSCFGPIRAGEARPSIPENPDDYSIILHLRDPRDVLTSLFFSHTFSHPREEGVFNPEDETRQEWVERGIDSFVVERSDRFLDRYEYAINHLFGKDSVIFLKYEEMVLDYQSWLKKFLSAFVSQEQVVSATEPRRGIGTLLEKLLVKQPPKLSFNSLYETLYEAHKGDFQVSNENVYQHKRQILPGDHQRKLRPETIAFLNQKFAQVLETLEYARL